MLCVHVNGNYMIPQGVGQSWTYTLTHLSSDTCQSQGHPHGCHSHKNSNKPFVKNDFLYLPGRHYCINSMCHVCQTHQGPDGESCHCTGWGDQLWTKLYFFDVLYRPSCLIGVYSSPEKYWYVFFGMKAAYLFNYTSFSLAMAYRRQRKVLQMNSAASLSHSVVMDGCRASRVVWGIA
jgi:hypothetical protein